MPTQYDPDTYAALVQLHGEEDAQAILSHHAPLSLTAAVFGPTLPKKSAQLDIFGGFTVHQTFPAIDADLLAMPVADNACPLCKVWHGNDLVPLIVTPVPLSDPEQGWNLYPCHEQECGCCYEVGEPCQDCGNVLDHCSCEHCDNCAELVDSCECYTCSHCGHKDAYGDDLCSDCMACHDGCCSCDRGGRASSRKLTPGWVLRGEEVPHSSHRHSDAAYDLRQNYAKHIDPAQMMSDFYLTEWVSAILTQKFGKAHLTSQGYVYAVPANNDAWSSARSLVREAQTTQQRIVHICEQAFADYGFMAIFGEARYHGNASDAMPISGRDGAWSWAFAMGEQYDRATLSQDCADLFRDENEQQWHGSGYGGEKWAIAADVMAAYFGGKLDARTFVDRTFSLQHNGGSFLNKISWACHNDSYMGTSDMIRLGNAHHAEVTDLATLLSGASEEVRSLVLRTVAQFRTYLPAVNVQNVAEWVTYDGSGDAAAAYKEWANAARAAYCTDEDTDRD